MTWKRNVLVVANVTATSDELMQDLEARAAREPASFTLVVPAAPVAGGREAAGENLSAALERLREVGLEVEGSVAHADPIVAVTDAWDPKRYDEIVVSTFPMSVSKWLHAGLPERIAKLTGAPVSHVVCQVPRPAIETAPAPAQHDRAASLGPLTVLGWGGQRQRSH